MDFLNTPEILYRVQKYVANDVNSKLSDLYYTVLHYDQVVISRFNSVFNAWSAVAIVPTQPGMVYEFVHDGLSNTTIVNIYDKKTTQEAIV